jgi:hypothetical protein
LVVALLVAGSAVPSAASPPAKRKPGQQLTAPPPGAPLASPLDRLVSVLKDQGHGEYSDTFAGLEVRPSDALVVVYTTDVGRGNALVAAGVAQLPEGMRAQARVEVRHGKYAFSRLDKARAVLWQEADKWKKAGAELYTISIRPDGSGLTVASSDPVKAAAMAGSISPAVFGETLPVADAIFEKGSPVYSTDRFDDGPPFWGAPR